MKTEELVKALRCTSAPCGTTGECETCPYYRKEHLNDELKEKIGVDIWTSCDTDKVGMDAAEQIERDQKEISELRKELEWKDMVIALAQKKQTEAEAERNKLKEKVDQYRALIPSWVIPKEDTNE